MPAPEIVDVSLVHTKHGEWLVVRPEDERALNVSEPYGYTRDAGKAVIIDGRYYVLHPTVAPGLGEWSEAASDAKEAALDAEFAKLSPEARAVLGLSDWEPIAARKAKRAAADAEAEVRALEARGVKGPELAQAKADAEARRAAVDDARSRKP